MRYMYTTYLHDIHTCTYTYMHIHVHTCKQTTYMYMYMYKQMYYFLRMISNTSRVLHRLSSRLATNDLPVNEQTNKQLHVNTCRQTNS